MAKHVKPTKEELDAKLQETIADAEKLKDAPTEEPKDDEPEEIKVVIPKEVEENPEEEKVEPVKEEPKEEPKEQPKEEVKEPDLKKKLSASARENQKIYAKNRVLNQAVIEAQEIPEPTEDELKAQYPEWDVMTDVERASVKEMEIGRKWRAKISEASNQAKKIEKWTDSVVEFIEDPKTLLDNPDLEGKEEEFTTFATDEANNSVPFNILVGAFLHQKTQDKVKHKGAMFETGSGGPNDKGELKTNKLTLEEGRLLRQTDYPKWVESVKAGKIDISV